MCPSVETITAITSPSATSDPPRTMEPTPMKMSANVPTNSATSLRQSRVARLILIPRSTRRRAGYVNTVMEAQIR